MSCWFIYAQSSVSPINTNLAPSPTHTKINLIQNFIEEKQFKSMENQLPRLPWFRLATMARAAEADSQSQLKPAQPAQAPPAPITRQPTLPITQIPVVPPPVPQTRAPTPPVPQPRAPTPPLPQLTSQPMVRPSLPSPTAQPAQTNRRPVTPPPQQDILKPAVPTNNSVSTPTTAPSPPPSPKVIKTSNPTPPPSPRVKTAPQAPPISVSNNKAANPEAENKPTPVLSQLMSIAMPEDRDKKVNGNGGSYNNTNNTNSVNGSADTSGKINGATYNNVNNKISNGGNGKNTSNGINHNNMNSAPHPERKEIENGRGMYEARGKPRHLNSGTAMPNSNHKKSERDMKVITIAGENIGALMELGHNSHSYGRKMHQGGNSLTSGSQPQDEKATESMDKKGGARAKPVTSLVNSNVQSINNSLLFNSSCTQKSPGVHLTFKSKSKGKVHKHGIDSPSS